MIRAVRNSFDNCIIQGGHPNSNLWCKFHAAAPSPILFEDEKKIRLYFRGQQSADDGSIGSISFETTDQSVFTGLRWDYLEKKLLISPGGEFDKNFCMNGSPVFYNGTLYMYYRGVTKNEGGTNSSYPLLATSTDGVEFTKKGKVNIKNATNVNVAVAENKIYATTSVAQNDGYGINLQYSTDGINFSDPTPALQLGTGTEWDSYSMSTSRLFYSDPYMYIVYSGSSEFKDYNEGFGIARSHKDSDFLEWEKYLENPIFLRGSGGSWDEGGLWSPQLFSYKNNLYLFYEGAGTGNLSPGNPDSRTVRSTAYGGYGTTNFSHVCTANMNLSEKELVNEWNKAGLYGKYLIRNVGTGKYLSISNEGVKYKDLPDATCIVNCQKTASGSFVSLQSDSESYFAGLYTETGKPFSEITANSSEDKTTEWFLYTHKNVAKIQNRYSGLFVAPYANSFIDGGSAGLRMEVNAPILWHEFIEV